MEINNYLSKEEYEKKMVNNYSVPWCFTNHAGHKKGAFFPFPVDEQQRKSLLRFLNRSDAHRVIILNSGSIFAFQWREFSPPLSSAHWLLQCYHRQKRDRRRCNSRGIPPQPPATRAISQWARSLEWRHAVTLPNLVENICSSFFLFYCEGMLSLVALWLCGDAQEFKHVLVCDIHFSEHLINKNEKLFLLIKKLKHVPLIASPSQMFLKGF